MIAKDKIFREYDIRGVVGEDFDNEFAYNLGKALAKKLKENGDNLRFGVGRDCRLSGPELHEQMVKGLTDSGVTAVDCQMGPTPQLYFSVHHLDLGGGVQTVSYTHLTLPTKA